MLKRWLIIPCFILIQTLVFSVDVFATTINFNYQNYLSALTENYDVNAIQIFTSEDLYEIRNDLSGSYILMNDIDMLDSTNSEWEPIGEISNPFTGVFDGNGHVIRNLKIAGNGESYGLFGAIETAELKSVGLNDVSIDYNYTSTTTNKIYASALCGYAYNSTINNCYVAGVLNISLNSNSYLSEVNAGGVCGFMSGQINNCYNTCTIIAKSTGYGSVLAGGICGEGGQISNCYNSGEITAMAAKRSGAAISGGICGSWGQIINCYNTGAVLSENSSLSAVLQGGGTIIPFACAGGISGNNAESISNCYNTGTISSVCNQLYYSKAWCGSLCGSVTDLCSILNSYWNTDVLPKENEIEQRKGVGDGNDATIPCNTIEMKNPSNFNEWDFIDVWICDASVNDGYPILRTFYNALPKVPEITKISVVDDCEISADISYENKDKAILVVAVFDNYMKVIDIQTKNITQSGTVVIENLQIPQVQGATIKVMMWNGFDVLMPLCPEKTVKFDGISWTDSI